MALLWTGEETARDFWLTDNGRLLCTEHLGYTARMTLHDLSGAPILRVTPGLARMMNADLEGSRARCEKCGREVPTT